MISISEQNTTMLVKHLLCFLLSHCRLKKKNEFTQSKYYRFSQTFKPLIPCTVLNINIQNTWAYRNKEQTLCSLDNIRTSTSQKFHPSFSLCLVLEIILFILSSNVVCLIHTTPCSTLKRSQITFLKILRKIFSSLSLYFDICHKD